MTVAEAATALGLTRARIRQLLGEGKIQGERLGADMPEGDSPVTVWVVPKSEVERYRALKASGAVRRGRPSTKAKGGLNEPPAGK